MSSTGTGNIRVAFTARVGRSYIIHLYEDALGSTQITQASYTNSSGIAAAAIYNWNGYDPGTYYVEVRETGSTTSCAIQSVVLAPSIVVEWEYFEDGDEPTDLATITFTHSVSHETGADISLNVTGMGADKYIVVRYPSTESAYTDWYNTSFNNGTIPDFAFEAIVTIGSWKYIKSRNALTMEESEPLLFTR